MIQLNLLQGATSVIHSVVHIDHFQGLVEQSDGGQDAIPVEPIGVQVIGFEVGRGDKAHTVVKQGIQEAMQDHGVGDVGHMKFIKTNELVLLGNLLAQNIQGIDRALQLSQFTMHFTHEFVEMQSRLALDGHGLVKTIHQKAFATPHATVHVNATRNGWAIDQLFERIRTFFFVLRPLGGTTLQRSNGSQLRWVALETSRLKLFLIVFLNGHTRPYCALPAKTLRIVLR